jgi:hypothetical protein
MADDQAPIPSDYVEVSERIEKFYEKHPDGSLQSTWTIATLQGRHEFRSKDGKTTCRQCAVEQGPDAGDGCTYQGFVVRAEAYRDKDDPRPAVGTAWEPFPGRTPYTAQSELMNAETSAWGRVLAALGFEVKNGIASSNEMQGRGGGGGGGGKPPSEAQLNWFIDLVGRTQLSEEDKSRVIAYGNAGELTGGQNGGISKAIDGLRLPATETEVATRLAAAAEKWSQQQAAPDGATQSTQEV